MPATSRKVPTWRNPVNALDSRSRNQASHRKSSSGLPGVGVQCRPKGAPSSSFGIVLRTMSDANCFAICTSLDFAAKSFGTLHSLSAAPPKPPPAFSQERKWKHVERSSTVSPTAAQLAHYLRATAVLAQPPFPLGPIMKVAVLFSGGKDSVLAAFCMQHQGHEVRLLTIEPAEYSAMFHHPNVQWCARQAREMGMPFTMVRAKGGSEQIGRAHV